MVVENAPDRNRGLLGSMVQLGYPIGQLAAIGMFAALSQTEESDFLAWAWRIPFLVSIVLVGVGLYIRLQHEETPVFREIEAKKAVARLPLAEVLKRQHRRRVCHQLRDRQARPATESDPQRHSYFRRRGARGDPGVRLAIRQGRPQGDVLCKLALRNGLRFPAVLAH
jgi:MFS family permease